MSKRASWPILVAVLANLLVTAIAAFLVSFFPLLFRSIDVAGNSADAFGEALISNGAEKVGKAMASCARGFEGIDSAGIQDLYRIETPAVSQYWMLRARLAGDLQLWLAFYEGSVVTIGRSVPCNGSIPSTPNASFVWVTTIYTNRTYMVEQWSMEGINTSGVPATRVKLLPTTFDAVGTSWYQDYVNSIYAHWRDPEVDTLSQYTAMRIGAQGGLNNSARYCVYAAEINSNVMTRLLSAIETSRSARMILFHTKTKALIGANFPYASVVNDSSGGASGVTTRPKLYTEITHESSLMASVVAGWKGAIEQCQSKCNLDSGASFDKLFLRVHRIFDEYGLDVTLVIAMPALDFLDEIQQAQRSSLSITLPVLTAIVVILSVSTWLTVRLAMTYVLGPAVEGAKHNQLSPADVAPIAREGPGPLEPSPASNPMEGGLRSRVVESRQASFR